jgi:hypothetical protein
VSWDELASGMGLGSKSTGTKYLIWAAQAYELIRKEGDKFLLSETGRKILAPIDAEEQIEAIIKAVTIPTLPSKFYSDYDGKFLPEGTFFDNVLESRYHVPRDRVAEAKAIIQANAEYAGILISQPNGKKTIRLNGAPAGRDMQPLHVVKTDLSRNERVAFVESEDPYKIDDAAVRAENSESLCFFITHWRRWVSRTKAR